MRDFSNKVVVITGAGSGIGRALAVNLAEKGARLALSDVNEVGVVDTAKLCHARGAEAKHYRLDVADREAVFEHAAQVRSDFGAINVVVNNAGVAVMSGVLEMSWEDYDWITGINLNGVVNGTKAFLPHLIESGDGHVVNVSSVFGFVGVPTQSAYNLTKFGVRGFTEALRQEMLIGKHPVAVSCVHPGGIKTNIAASARSVAGDDSAKRGELFHRIARTTPEGAAKTIVRGMQRRSPRILIGLDAWGLDFFPRLFGARYQDLVAFFAGPVFAFMEKRGVRAKL
ncbi:short-chain dehydrogenase/reductase SDR [Segniliparus rotundus DSM 44985]|uniref:Short-chain dehydrogenase/reductase SDR n=1 Tax=Segniliparus rotundus (strain ATCC BAA-972 / CDC 1076 / CIP 108378 / DSM 44985 / JCM 13578) TaxID=640132 RepID=D6Z966_SEGRD|nr:SDR family oxidoreductase [Segniliparus rotundus]ADG98496.1 short-chain dehydrogenase/reductase SDR [Segniliparus rotundus DSM 44985]